MAKVKNRRVAAKRTPAEMARRAEVRSRLKSAATADIDELLESLETTRAGLSEERIEAAREQYGDNTVTRGKKTSLLKHIVNSFANPFTAILFCLAVVSAFTDIILAEPGEVTP